MIIAIAYSIRYFLIALFIVLAGFSQGFWILSNMDADSDFGTIRGSLWSSFMTMLGAMQPEFEPNHNASPAFARYLLVVFMMVMMILMLNILIALMGDTFTNVRDSGLALWRKEQAAICIEEMISPVKSDAVSENNRVGVCPYIHVLQYTSDIGTSDSKVKLSDMVNTSKDHVQKFTPLESDNAILNRQ